MQNAQKEKVPNEVFRYRKLKCGDCSCNVDFNDGCSRCPKNKWQTFSCYENNYKHDNAFDEKNTKDPNVLKLTSNFADASIKELISFVRGDKSISKEEKEKRMKICESCVFFDNSSKRCKKCGCFLLIKTAWRTQTCPIGKW
jgi:hypothetical protein